MMEKIKSPGGDCGHSRVPIVPAKGSGITGVEQAQSQPLDQPVALGKFHSRSEVHINAFYNRSPVSYSTTSLQHWGKEQRGFKQDKLINKGNDILHKVMHLCCSSQNLSVKGKPPSGKDDEDKRPKAKPRERRSRWSAFFGNGLGSKHDLRDRDREDSPRDRARRNSSPGILRFLSRSPRRRERTRSMPSISGSKNERQNDDPSISEQYSRAALDQKSGVPRSESLPRRVDFTPDTKDNGVGSVVLRKAMRPPQLEGEALQSPLTVRDGESCHVTVKVSGIPIPDITWFHGSREIKNCPDFRVDDKGTSCTLYIASVTEELSSRGFTVKAVNRVGVQQHPVIIKVYKVHTKWRAIPRSESFSTRSPDGILRHKQRKGRRVHAGISMTSLRSAVPPKKPPRSLSVGERDWAYAHANHSTDSIIDDVFSFDRKSAFATSTPNDVPTSGNKQMQRAKTLPRSSKVAPETTSTKRQPDAMTDSGFSEENIFRFRCSESDYKSVQVDKAPPLALPEDFDDDAFDSPLCSPRSEEKMLTPKSNESRRDEVDLGRGESHDWLVKQGNRFTANAQLWLSDKKTHKTQSANAIYSADVTDGPGIRSTPIANQHIWPSEEKMKQKSNSVALEPRINGAKVDKIPTNQQKGLHSCNGVNSKGKIETVIRRTNVQYNGSRPVSETNLDDYYKGFPPPYTSLIGSSEKERVDQQKSLLQSKPPRPASALRRSLPSQTNGSVRNNNNREAIEEKAPSERLECTVEDSSPGKRSPIISRKFWRDSGIPRLNHQGKRDQSPTESGKNRPRSSSEPAIVGVVQTKADIHMSMEGPSHCPGWEQPKGKVLDSSKVLDSIDKARILQDKINQERSSHTVRAHSPQTRRRAASAGNVQWVYVQNMGNESDGNSPKQEKAKYNSPKSEKQLPCVKILDEAISMIYAEASSYFGDDVVSPDEMLPDKKEKENEQPKCFVSTMYEYPRMTLLDAPLPRLSEVSDEGSVASYMAARGSWSVEPTPVQTEEVFSDDSIETEESQCGINTNTNNHHDLSSIGPYNEEDSITLEVYDNEKYIEPNLTGDGNQMSCSHGFKDENGNNPLDFCTPENDDTKEDIIDSNIQKKMDKYPVIDEGTSKSAVQVNYDDFDDLLTDIILREINDHSSENLEHTENITYNQLSRDKMRIAPCEAVEADEDSFDTESVDTVIELPSSSDSESERNLSNEIHDFVKDLIEEIIKNAIVTLKNSENNLTQSNDLPGRENEGSNLATESNELAEHGVGGDVLAPRYGGISEENPSNDIDSYHSHVGEEPNHSHRQDPGTFNISDKGHIFLDSLVSASIKSALQSLEAKPKDENMPGDNCIDDGNERQEDIYGDNLPTMTGDQKRDASTDPIVPHSEIKTTEITRNEHGENSVVEQVSLPPEYEKAIDSMAEDMVNGVMASIYNQNIKSELNVDSHISSPPLMGEEAHYLNDKTPPVHSVEIVISTIPASVEDIDLPSKNIPHDMSPNLKEDVESWINGIIASAIEIVQEEAIGAESMETKNNMENGDLCQTPSPSMEGTDADIPIKSESITNGQAKVIFSDEPKSEEDGVHPLTDNVISSRVLTNLNENVETGANGIPGSAVEILKESGPVKEKIQPRDEITPNETDQITPNETDQILINAIKGSNIQETHEQVIVQQINNANDIDILKVEQFVEFVIMSAAEIYQDEHIIYEALMQGYPEGKGYSIFHRTNSLSSIEEESVSDESTGYVDESFQLDNYQPNTNQRAQDVEKSPSYVLQVSDHIEKPQKNVESNNESEHTQEKAVDIPSNAKPSVNNDQNYMKVEKHEFSSDTEMSSFTEEDNVDLSWDNEMGPKFSFETSDLSLLLASIQNQSEILDSDNDDVTKETINGKQDETPIRESGSRTLKDTGNFDGESSRIEQAEEIVPANANINYTQNSKISVNETPRLEVREYCPKTSSGTEGDISTEEKECPKDANTPVAASIEPIKRELQERNWGAILVLLLAIIIMCIITWWSSADE